MSIAAVAVCSTAAFAEDTDVSSLQNVLYFDAPVATIGRTANLSVQMKGSETVQSIGAYVTLPTGVTAAGASLGALVPEQGDAAYADEISTNTVEGVARVALLGATGKALTAANGEAFKLAVTVSSDATPGEQPVVISNHELCTTDSKATLVDTEVTSTLKIVLLGDVNADGNVNIGDANTVISVSRGGSAVGEPDVNDDKSVNIGDVNAVINIVRQ